MTEFNKLTEIKQAITAAPKDKVVEVVQGLIDGKVCDVCKGFGEVPTCQKCNPCNGTGRIEPAWESIYALMNAHAKGDTQDMFPKCTDNMVLCEVYAMLVPLRQKWDALLAEMVLTQKEEG